MDSSPLKGISFGMPAMNRAEWHLERGRGRTRVELGAFLMGEELVVCLYNERAHLGAVVVAEWDRASGRASTSVITRLGHKDDTVAIEAAHEIAKATHRPVCIIAGIHVDNITSKEIGQIVQHCRKMVAAFVVEIGVKG